MCRVLVLTKNILSEKSLQEKLQHLNHEVYCSKDIPQNMGQREKFLNYFQCVIISETFTDSEFEKILSIFKKRMPTPIIFRNIEGEVTVSETLKENGLQFEYLPIDTSLEELRERIVSKLEVKKDQECNMMMLETGGNDIQNKIRDVRLSSKEKRLLEVMIQYQGNKGSNIVSRETICREIWKTAPSNSTYSQLSTIVKKIRGKFQLVGIEGETIETIWGKGYKLNSNFLSIYSRNTLVDYDEVIHQ